MAKKQSIPIPSNETVETVETAEAVEIYQSEVRLQKYTSNPHYTFYLKTLKELAIPYRCLEFKCKRDGMPSTGMYMVPDKDGNIRFYTPSITGEIESYVTDAVNAKVQDWYLTRFATPKKLQDGSEARYMPVPKGGTRLLITPNVIEAYRDKTVIDTLYLIEGFKKALSLYSHSGNYVIGMNGLTGFKEPAKDKIRVELREILIDCKVKRVVIMDDSDLFDLSEGKDNPETYRPNNFYRAAIQAKTLIEPFSDVVLVHPNPCKTEKLGFDDLLLKHRIDKFNEPDLFLQQPKPDLGHESVFRDLEKTISTDEGMFFSILRLSAVVDHKIRAYFHLDDVNSFYNYHIDKLKPKGKFNFYSYCWKVREDGALEEVKEDETFGYKVKNGSIYRAAGAKDKDGDVLISNFTIKILFHIKGDENVRVCEIINSLNQRAIIEVCAEDIASNQRFRSLCVNQGEYMFYGGQDDLMKIIGMTMKHERQATVFSNLGYQPGSGVWAFSNGVATVDGWKPCDEFGITEHNENIYYFPAFSKFNAHKSERFADERKYIHIEPEKKTTFEQWKQQFCKVYGSNGEITVCYYLACLFSDIVFNHPSGIGFPLLFASGKPKTGKSTIFISLLKLFGEGLNGESLTSNSTFKFLFTQLAKNRNGLVFFDEYSNDDRRVFDFLKNVFDRRPYGTKQYSNDTKTRIVPVLASAIVAGEVMPTGNHALFTRTISMMFNRTADQRTDTEKEDFRLLTLMEANGLTSITVSILKHRHLIENKFNHTFDTTRHELDKEFKGLPVDGRMIQSAAWVLSVVRILIDEKVIEYGIEWTDLIDIWVKILVAQNQQIQTNTDIAKFWEIVEQLHRNGIISEDGGDYKFESDMLVLRLSRVVLPYAKKALELHYSKVLDKSSLKNYLENEPYYLAMVTADGRPKATRFSGSQSPVEGLWFDYDKLTEMYGICLTKQTWPTNEPGNPATATPAPQPGQKQEDGKQNDLPF